MSDIHEFRPILPHITDTSMISPDVEYVEDNDKKKHNNNIKRQLPNGIGSTIIKGLLITLIVIFCVILIYQLYKYYTENDEIEQVNNVIPTEKTPPLTKNIPIVSTKQKISSVKIPDNINILDNDYLSRHIKKNKTKLDSVNEVDIVNILVNEQHKHNNITENETAENETAENETAEFDTSLIIEEIKDENLDNDSEQKTNYTNKCTYIAKKGRYKGIQCGKICEENLCNSHKT